MFSQKNNRQKSLFLKRFKNFQQTFYIHFTKLLQFLHCSMLYKCIWNSQDF